MARNFAISLLIFGYASCMEMRETVERMVMVRTTGSDLQPAATGFIYKKESDGPEKVIKMGESEVMEHLKKIYEKPQAYLAPISSAKGPFHNDDDESKSASYTSEVVKPVNEKSDESEDVADGHIEGIADEDYKKYLDLYKTEPYGSDFGNYKDLSKDFSDYLHGVGDYGHGLFDIGGGSDYGVKGHHDYGDDGYKGYAGNHKYGKGGAGDYHTENYQSFSIKHTGGHGKHHDDRHNFGKDQGEGHGYKGNDHGYKAAHVEGKEVDGYHKLFNKDEHKKDHDFYDTEKDDGKFREHGSGHDEHGYDAGGHRQGGSHKARHHQDHFGTNSNVDKKSGDESGEKYGSEGNHEESDHNNGSFGIKEGKHDSKSYDFHIKH